MPPLLDPLDVGYELDDFDPERDSAPAGAGHDCSGDQEVEGHLKLAKGKATSQAERLGWGRGWPNCSTADIVTVVCGAQGVRLPMRRLMAPLVAGMVVELEASRAQAFNPAWCWGMACRPIAGTRRASNHSQGTSPDLDAPENPHLSAAAHAAPHPLRKRVAGRLLRTTMPPNVVDVAARWGFAWGGLYGSKPDPMHFDPAVTPAQAERLAADLRALAGRPGPTPPAPPQEDHDVKFWLMADNDEPVDKRTVFIVRADLTGRVGVPNGDLLRNVGTLVGQTGGDVEVLNAGNIRYVSGPFLRMIPDLTPR